MSLESEIYARLSGTTAITDIVPAGRIYFGSLADNTPFPAVSYQRVGTLRNHTLAGRVGLSEALYQVDCWSRSDVEMVKLAKQVRLALDGWRENGRIEMMRQENELDLLELEGTVYRRMQSYRVMYQEEES